MKLDRARCILRLHVISSIVIFAVSGVLSLYWFRYTCRLILSAKTSHDYAADLAHANRLEFARLRDRLRHAGPSQLGEIEQALRNEYYLLAGLLEQAARPGQRGLEEWMLRVDYWVMAGWFRVARALFPASCGSAVTEMCDIVTYLANTLGQSAPCAESL